MSQKFEYKFIYLPTHPKASSNGCVYEHVLVAEQKLGRYLKDDETVHHIDRNKKNNNPENLMVFATNSDHAAFHAGCEIYEKDNIWHANKTGRKINSETGKTYLVYNHICKVCNKEFMSSNKNQLFCSNQCRARTQTTLPKPEILQQQLIKEHGNFSAISKTYNVSSSAIHKYLKNHNLPNHSKDYR